MFRDLDPWRYKDLVGEESRDTETSRHEQMFPNDGRYRFEDVVMRSDHAEQAEQLAPGNTTDERMVGLQNRGGDQNCFLNVVIQALWRLRRCRSFFLELANYDDVDPISDALVSLFTEYKFTDESILPPDRVRHAMAAVYANLDRFQIGQMDDAGESFDGILNALHGNPDIDKPCKNRSRCLGHSVFAASVLREDHFSQCRYVKSFPEETTFTQRVYVRELVNTHPSNHDLGLDEAIRLLTQFEGKPCPVCRKEDLVLSKTFLLSQPEVLCLNLVWPQLEGSHDELESVLRKVRGSLDQFRMDVAFPPAGQGMSLPPFRLSGFICFYPGRHYVYIGRVHDVWCLFDDHQIKRIGLDFDEVIDRCLRAKYQPVSLFYESRQNGTQFADVVPHHASYISTRQDSFAASPRSLIKDRIGFQRSNSASIWESSAISDSTSPLTSNDHISNHECNMPGSKPPDRRQRTPSPPRLTDNQRDDGYDEPSIQQYSLDATEPRASVVSISRFPLWASFFSPIDQFADENSVIASTKRRG